MTLAVVEDLFVVLIVLMIGAMATSRWETGLLRVLSRGFEALGIAAIGFLGILGLTGPSRIVGYATVWQRWHLLVGLTPLGGFFLAILALLSAAAFVYAPGYLASYMPQERHRMRALLVLFTLSMAFVLLSQDAVTFLAAWEGMSLTSLGLVVTEHRHGRVRRAGFVYFVATHAGAMALIAFFALMESRGLGIDFRVYAAHAVSLPVGLRTVLLALALVGFGSKAALVPMHVWLPRAHPVAPSHVSALMSGVMVKIALYGLILGVFGWLGRGPAWWGGLLVVLGLASCLFGVLYALMEHGLKILLAYHTIENVGIIVLGLGAAELARTLGAPLVMDFALSASLFHVLNHAIFKSGLFLAAGSVLQAAHTDDLERLGGLARGMPYTATAFILLSVAISGLPPFNGFASEWMVLESLLRVAHLSLPDLGTAGMAVLGALGLALTGGLAAACFVKAAGVGFLGPARSREAREVREVRGSMIAPPLALAAVSLALGLVPGAVEGLAMRIAGGLVPGPQAAGIVPILPALGLMSPWTHAEWPVLWLLSLALVGGFLLVVLQPAFGRTARRLPAWACGGVLSDPSSAYSAMAFSKSIRQIFTVFYRPERVLIRSEAALPYLYRDIRYENTIRHVTELHLYRPSRDYALRVARFLRRLQSGSLRNYIGYLLVTLLAALVIWGH